jgi:hypothetical protein
LLGERDLSLLHGAIEMVAEVILDHLDQGGDLLRLKGLQT